MSYTPSSKDIAAFRRAVWAHYRDAGRHDLPWRKTRDPYKVLVSEMMLQQTQVARVVPKYTSFIKKFPTARVLAKAPLSAVLKEWSGLGYNRRAKYLHDAAKAITTATADMHISSPVGLLICRGVGPYTRDAVAVFASNEARVLLETNIRTVFIHHFFPKRRSVSDAELGPLLHKAAEGQDPREWHAALMDYGAHLKQSGVRLNAKSRHYAKQPSFKGSLRQMRGQILRDIGAGTEPGKSGLARAALRGLARDGLIRRAGKDWELVR